MKIFVLCLTLSMCVFYLVFSLFKSLSFSSLFNFILFFMTLSLIQTTLMSLSFGLLLLLMVVYWLQIAFFSLTPYKKYTFVLLSVSIFSLTSQMLLRWIESGHFPLSNLYESLLFLSWSFLMTQLFFQLNENQFSKLQREMFFENNKYTVDFVDMIGVITSPLALLTYGFAFLKLPREMQQATTLVPALQSNWLMMHVTIMILSYAALICGSLLSMAFLLITQLDFMKPSERKENDLASPKSQNSFGLTEVFAHQTNSTPNKTVGNGEENVFNFGFYDLSLASRLDNLSYRVLGLGFPLLTIGILSGAVWANEAWGSYWSWDPKETWALITWLVFAIYFHARMTKGWNGKRPAIIATLGFFVVWFCYLGVNLLGTGLHSYGWFSNTPFTK